MNVRELLRTITTLNIIKRSLTGVLFVIKGSRGELGKDYTVTRYVE